MRATGLVRAWTARLAELEVEMRMARLVRVR